MRFAIWFPTSLQEYRRTDGALLTYKTAAAAWKIIEKQKKTPWERIPATHREALKALWSEAIVLPCDKGLIIHPVT